MPTLLLPLIGPLQSWGLDARFRVRTTALEPSKSGVIGLFCAALGRDRAEPIDDLAALRFGVRVDREGTLMRDFHTALEVAAAGNAGTDTVVSERWYLADASFIAGFEGDAELLNTVHQALRHPRWPVFLGRKACLPSVPLFAPDGLVDESLDGALRSWHLNDVDAASSRRLVIEDTAGPQLRPDQPAGSFAERRFTTRRVRTEFMQCS